MPLRDYYERFWLQVFVPVPDGFGGQMNAVRDGSEIRGLFIKPTQSQTREAEAQRIVGYQVFTTDMAHLLDVNDIIRREEGDTYHRIIGLPQLSPGPAISKFQVLPSETLVTEAVVRA